MTWFEHIAALLARDIDMELVRRQLALTPTQRLEKLEAMRAFSAEARRARAATAQDADRRVR
jgi:hypothetical protein